MTELAEQLPVGRTVCLKEHHGFGVLVALLPEGSPGDRVHEVGPEHLVLVQLHSGLETRIPAYLVRVEPASPSVAAQPGA